MRAASDHLLGRHDFRAFSSTGSPRASTVRCLQHVHFLARREKIALLVQADGFLYNMVRTIAGTLIDVGRGRFDPSVVARALAEGSRELAGPTAPASGLYLLSVQYAERTFTRPEGAPHGPPGVFPTPLRP
jgi:tRNA pseudouridine38-40 synthase